MKPVSKNNIIITLMILQLGSAIPNIALAYDTSSAVKQAITKGGIAVEKHAKKKIAEQANKTLAGDPTLDQVDNSNSDDSVREVAPDCVGKGSIGIDTCGLVEDHQIQAPTDQTVVPEAQMQTGVTDPSIVPNK